MNYVNNLLEYYESDDFKSDYAFILTEDTHAVRQNISEYLKSWEFKEKHGHNVYEYDNSAFIDAITEFVLDNAEKFTVDIHAYNCPSLIVSSVIFGEQEEQLSHYDEWKTDKEGLIEHFEEKFFVNGEYAYYILDTGLGVDIELALSDPDCPKL